MATQPKPSARQVYYLAHLMAEAIDVQFPETRSDASELIRRLKGSAGDAAAELV